MTLQNCRDIVCRFSMALNFSQLGIRWRIKDKESLIICANGAKLQLGAVVEWIFAAGLHTCGWGSGAGVQSRNTT